MKEQLDALNVAGEPRSHRDGSLPAEFLRAILRVWRRDMDDAPEAAGVGHLAAAAAELSEFGLGEVDVELYRRAAEHSDRDARGFAGLRRAARRASDNDALRAAYEQELHHAANAEAAVLAAVGLARVRMRMNDDAHSVLRGLDAVSDEVAASAPELRELHQICREDALIRCGQPEEALELRARRWEGLSTGPNIERERSRLAVSSAVTARELGMAAQTVLEWFDIAFEAGRDPEAVRALIRRLHDDNDAEAAAGFLAEVAANAATSDERGSAGYRLGMLRAFRLDDRPGGLQALSEALRSGSSAPVAASAFLSLARASFGSVVPDAIVDALSVRLELAAGGVERADILTQMARRFDADLDLPDAAMEMAQEALDECGDYVPAMRVLGHIYAREGQWAELATLTEREIAATTSPLERLRLHERVARVYSDRIGDYIAAETHLRTAVELRPSNDSVRRLSDILTEQCRWEELYAHLRAAAEKVTLRRERVFLTEQAASVAENRLRDAALAIDAYRQLLSLDAGNSTAIAGLDRLYERTERWEELLQLNELEVSTERDVEQRLAIVCRSADIAASRIGDSARAEHFYRAALALDPACDPALRGLGAILSAEQRWQELVEMSERELRAATTPEHEARCLRHLGELYATRTNDTGRAVDAFIKLADLSAHRQEALVWLERLYEAAGDPNSRLAVMMDRRESADTASQARLSFRIAELLEWQLQQGAEAFSEYATAATDALCAAESMIAIDRLWNADGVDNSARRAALRQLLEVAARHPRPLRHSAMRLVAERGDGLMGSGEIDALWRTINREWPEDLVAAESCAVRNLRSGDIEVAEQAREAGAPTASDRSAARLSQLDRGVEDGLCALPSSPVLAAYVNREEGGVVGFDGAGDRELLQAIRADEVSLHEIRGADDSELALRLSVLGTAATGDRVGAREDAEALARSLSDPRRATRAWLDLAADTEISAAECRRLLSCCDAVGCYDSALRERLYDEMKAAGDDEALEEAISRHLEMPGVSADYAARLALRRGRALERLGRSEDAIAALAFAAIHEPTDASIALEKARLEAASKRNDAARRTLDEALQAGIAGDDRLTLLSRVADLNLIEGGDHARAIRALEDAFELSTGDREVGLRLAHVQANFGDPERCVSLLERLLSRPIAEQDLFHWQLYARVQSLRFERHTRAAEVLWEVFERFPQNRSALSGLEEHYRRTAGARAFATRLRELISAGNLAISQSEEVEMWIYTGELFFSVVEDFAEADRAWRHAEELGGAGPRLKIRRAQALVREGGRVGEAPALVLSALKDAENAAAWRDGARILDAAYTSDSDAARVRVVRQIRALCGDEVEIPETQVRRDPTRAIEATEAWQLFGGSVGVDELDVLHGIAPLAEKVLGGRGADAKSLRAGRYTAERFPRFDRFFDDACAWLGVERPRLSVADHIASPVFVDGTHIVMPVDRVGNDNELVQRFWAGYAAGAAFTGLGSLSRVDDNELIDLARAVAIRCLNLEVPEGSTFTDDIGGFRLTPQRRTASAALRDAPQVLGIRNPQWSRLSQSIGSRAGLLFAGDIGVAVTELLRAAGQAGTADVLDNGRARELVRWALSDDYLQARYESGLGRRPWTAETPEPLQLGRVEGEQAG